MRTTSVETEQLHYRCARPSIRSASYWQCFVVYHASAYPKVRRYILSSSAEKSLARWKPQLPPPILFICNLEINHWVADFSKRLKIPIKAFRASYSVVMDRDIYSYICLSISDHILYILLVENTQKVWLNSLNCFESFICACMRWVGMASEQCMCQHWK